MLYTLVLWVCAGAAPCPIEQAEAVIGARNLTVEECMARGPRAAAEIVGEGKFYRLRCRLDPTHKRS